MNMFLQNITKFVTSVCYDVAIKQKLIMANLPKGWYAKQRGLSPKGYGGPAAIVQQLLK